MKQPDNSGTSIYPIDKGSGLQLSNKILEDDDVKHSEAPCGCMTGHFCPSQNNQIPFVTE